MSAGNGNPFQPEFIQIPYAVFRDPNLSASAKLAYGRLKLYAGADGHCFMAHRTLAAEICLGRRQTQKILDELRAAGWIDWEWSRGETATYTVRQVAHKSAQGDTHKSAQPLRRKVRKGCAQKCAQNRGFEDHHLKRGLEKKNPEASVEGSTAGEASKKTPKPTTDSLRADDDKNYFPPESPETRLKAWATNRGDPLSLKDWWDIKAQAEVRGLALGELADLAEKNNGHWKSSAAGLRWLLKQFARKTTDAPAEVVTPQPVEKCPKCRCPKGRGTVLVNGHLEACECATAEWRRQIAQAAARDAANGSNAIKPVAEVLQHPVPIEVAE
jgi:hypothetical protein